MTHWEYMRVWLNFYHFETQGPEDILDIKHNGKLIKSIDISPPDYTEYAWIQ